MANSHPGRHIARLTAACCASLLGVAAAAQPARETQKIVMDAVPVEVNYRNNTAVFRDVVTGVYKLEHRLLLLLDVERIVAPLHGGSANAA